MAKEDVCRIGVIEQSPSATNHGSPLASNIVGKRQAGSKVVVILGVQLFGRNVVPAVGGVKGPEQPILFAGDSEIIPTHAVGQCQARRPPEAILHEEAMAVLEGMSSGIAC